MNNSEPSHHVELFVRAGQDGDSYGACPFCQRIYMILMLKSSSGDLSFDLKLVNQARPRNEFRKIANRLPVLKHGDEVLTDNDEIVKYIEANFTKPDLKFDNAYANAVCLEVFSKFAYYVKQVNNTPDQLRQELWRINDYIEKTGTKFLCGDDITNLDTLVLPKLQHIRVAAKALKNMEFPASMKGIWTYLKNAYDAEVFRKSCPSDQEIVNHWASKQETPSLTDEAKRFYNTETEPRFTFFVPEGF